MLQTHEISNLPDGAAEGTVPVSARTVLCRLRRRLARKGQELVRPHNRFTQRDLGDYFIINRHTQGLVARFVDVEARARTLNVLKPYEYIAEPGTVEGVTTFI